MPAGNNSRNEFKIALALQAAQTAAVQTNQALKLLSSIKPNQVLPILQYNLSSGGNGGLLGPGLLPGWCLYTLEEH